MKAAIYCRVSTEVKSKKELAYRHSKAMLLAQTSHTSSDTASNSSSSVLMRD